MVHLLTSKHTELLYKTLKVYSLRNEILQNNIANVDTPDFKKSEVRFEGVLSDALRKNRLRDVDLSDINPAVEKVDENYTQRIDGNNVDIDAENVQLYVNALKVDAITNTIMTNSRIKNLAILGR